MLFGTSGVKFFRTSSNITGQNARPNSKESVSFFLNFIPLGMSN
jgi:hypothetical protein